MGDSWDILHRWEPISRNRNPDSPSPLPKTTVEQLKAQGVARGLSINLAHFCPSSVPQEGLSLCWLSRCHVVLTYVPIHTHTHPVAGTNTSTVDLGASLYMRLPPPHHKVQFCCQLVKEKPHHLLFFPATSNFLPRVSVRNLSRKAALGAWFQPCPGVWSRLLTVTGGHLCGPALWLSGSGGAQL